MPPVWRMPYSLHLKDNSQQLLMSNNMYWVIIDSLLKGKMFHPFLPFPFKIWFLLCKPVACNEYSWNTIHLTLNIIQSLYWVAHCRLWFRSFETRGLITCLFLAGVRVVRSFVILSIFTFMHHRYCFVSRQYLIIWCFLFCFFDLWLDTITVVYLQLKIRYDMISLLFKVVVTKPHKTQDLLQFWSPCLTSVLGKVKCLISFDVITMVKSQNER